ncbi:MoaD/ThiS family protein [Corynebacterium vitaeruminis]|uniref:Molybdopterin biosynthesis protein MoaD2 n=1 Tax=Corynebacterium vitaeruminis DSM 20294 TaxID=1224164 RepID=W5XX23_9CORY|nr:MoaD/ThiS family protein [Corynebacterium vitaeruminis]AHI21561.1 molybdopterin biosynthesis protein MoaD2 [Corynebacterium vitaeruminis DSM 20294]
MEIHYFAAARAARGVAVDKREEEFPTLGALLERLASENAGTTDAGMSLGEVFARCTFLIDGRAAAPEESLEGATRVDVLPPFAGG